MSDFLQTRAAFLKHWDWDFIIRLNRAACERGKYQHGLNTEKAARCAVLWADAQHKEMTLAETLELLKRFHGEQPFLFFNGNVFAELGRRLVEVLAADLAALRRRELTSAVAHYVAGVLDVKSMIGIVDGMFQRFAFQVGDQVQSLRGSVHGVVASVDGDTIQVRLSTGSLAAFSAASLIKVKNLP